MKENLRRSECTLGTRHSLPDDDAFAGQSRKRSAALSFNELSENASEEFSPDAMFLSLVADMHLIMGETPPEVKPQNEPGRVFDLTVDDIHFVIAYLPDVDSFNIFIQCIYGPIPINMVAPALMRLLKINTLLAFQNQGGFAVDPTTDEVLLVYRVPIQFAQAAPLLQSIGLCAVQAKSWRETYFLENTLEEQTDLVMFKI